MPGSTEPRLQRYVTGWVAAAVLTIAAAAAVSDLTYVPPAVTVTLLLVLTLVTRNVRALVPVHGVRGHTSLQELGGILPALFLPPVWAVVGVGLAVLVSELIRIRGARHKTAFNTASQMVAVGAASIVFHVLAGTFGVTPLDLVAALTAGVVLVVVSVAAFSGLVVRLADRRLGGVLREEAVPALLDIGITVTGIVTAVVAVTAPWALPLLVLPAVLDWLRMKAERPRYELATAVEHAQAANRAKSEFLSRMSHELRTPLNAVLGFGQLIQEHPDLDDEIRDWAEVIGRSGHHLLELIDEVLDISRIEAGRLDVSPTVVDVERVASDAIELLQPLAAERCIRLSLRREATTRYVTADTQRLRQILLNLLSNAVKYNRDGGTAVVHLADGPDGRLRIDVRDTGFGIAPADLEKLFVPFERLDAAERDIEGNGLGLALSRALAEAMDGRLTATSRFRLGSTFTLELPAAPAPPAAPPARPSPGLAAPMSSTAVGTVVYVEDDDTNVELVRRVLARRSDVRLRVAPDVATGLALIRRESPDLVLLDLQLPGGGGEELLRRLRRDAVTAGLPVTILSADASPRRVEQLLAAGADGYLTKPLNVSELVAVVDRAMGADAIGGRRPLPVG